MTDVLRLLVALALSLDTFSAQQTTTAGRGGRDDEGIAELKQELALPPKSIHSDTAARLIENPRRAREPYAPSFSMVTLSREFVELDELRGKVVLLDFWARGARRASRRCQICGTCRSGTRRIRSSSSESAPTPDERVLRDFVATNQMEWTQYWDRDRKVQQLYDIRGWPTYIVIDDEGS